MTQILVSIITGVFTLAGVCLTVFVSGKRTGAEVAHKLETAQAVTDTKLDELTREVREHNGFAQRIPLLEERQRAAEHRMRKLETEGERV